MFKSKLISNGLISIGFVALIFGVGGAIVEMVLGLHKDILEAQEELMFFGKMDGPKWSPEWLRALGQFLDDVASSISNLIIVIRESPLWLSLTIIGIGLIISGLNLMPKNKQ